MENTADVRIAQYESNTRKPKEDMLWKIAEVLDVNYRWLYEPMRYAAEDVMYTLFELDEQYNHIQIHDITNNFDPYIPETHKAVSFNVHILDDFLSEWQERKKTLPMALSARPNIWNGNLTIRRRRERILQNSSVSCKKLLPKTRFGLYLLSKCYQISK